MATAIDWASDTDSDVPEPTEPTEPTDADELCRLTIEEVEDVVRGIRFGFTHNKIQENIIQRHREKTRRKLLSITTRPSKLPELKKIILQQFYSSVVASGEAVGVNAAQCIGEPTTQMSNISSDQVIVYSEHDGSFYHGPIGDFVDTLMEKSEITDLGSESEVVHFSEEQHYIFTVNPNNERCEWKSLCEVSRHPANGDLVRITTKSGRSVTTTLTHSHLRRTAEGKIKPIVAANLELGDFIPVAKKLPHQEQISTIEIGTKKLDLDFHLGLIIGTCLVAGEGEKKQQTRFNKFIKNEFGETSSKKRIPGWVYFAPLTFINGLINGCFGDSTRVPSINRRFAEDIALLLNYFGIFSTIKNEGKSYTLMLCSQSVGIFLEQIKNGQPISELVVDERNIDYIPMCGWSITDAICQFGSPAVLKNTVLRETVRSHLQQFLAKQTSIQRFDWLPVFWVSVYITLYLQDYVTVAPWNVWGILIITICWIVPFLVKLHALYTINKMNLLQASQSFFYYFPLINPQTNDGLSLISQAVNSDVIWDKITSIETISTEERVYDLGVLDNHTFMVNAGVFVHNTLNTFHHTGQSAKNVTLGFPRARELFNATKSPSNPTCTIYFTRDNESPAALHNVADKFPEAIIEDLIMSWEVFEPTDYELTYWHNIWFKLEPHFGELTEDDWCLRLKFDVGKLYEYDVTVKDIAQKLKSVYADIRCIASPLNVGIIDVLVNCVEIGISGPRSNELDYIKDDDEARYFYMHKIVSPKIRGQVVCGIPRITTIYRRKAKVNESYGIFPLKDQIQARLTSDEEWIVDTDGTNLSEILTQPGVDSYRTISNDMWEIMNILGIEAARTYLYLEFMNIVSGGGISINPVHIQVLVDKMTYTGSIRAIARFGVETAQYDPIARATFEEVMSQIITSAMFSEKDNLNGVSSNIVLGTKINAGTGRIDFEDIPLRVVRPKQSENKTKIRPPKKLVTEDI